ncbi:MAG TPA: hypothetical protein VNM69_05605 [Bacillus sp. (in: firmicutes)]|uniref:hypothetical protein n=1 Tax=Bacillus litorisediminis TaxID=2922713 RepID=UPI001FAC6199|nr:hypothetical protein [Bacillus litorisediminis]HWO75383.1 hypothetical protein [Bacillus sp. (in: firmicutes)]
MFITSTGQVGGLLNLSILRIDLMNKTTEAQVVNLLIFDTSVSPKAAVFDETFIIAPSSGTFRNFTPTIFPSQYEVVIRANTPNIVPFITGTAGVIGTLDVNATFKSGDFFRWELPGVDVEL